MMKRVHTYHSPEIEAKGSERMRSLVEVRLKDGRSFQREAFTSRGQPDRPMSSEELAAKFTDCARATLTPARMERALELIHGVEKLPSVSALVEPLVGE